ncbi:AraC family transcriptional regulator [Paenibacillus sp. FSL E2-0201]|uniref:helix-turn-helix transcriptional regulator n=1 Tax=Paenibacillus sp. FSL E2-0201 TaxID=2954726 RepID=UPI0030DC3631
MKNNNVTDALLSFLADRGIVVELLYEQQKIILLCMASLEDCAVLTDILVAAAGAFSSGSSPDGISLSLGIGEVVTEIMQAHLSFLLADQACQIAVFFGMPVMEVNRWTKICHVSGRWLSDWSEQVDSCVRYAHEDFEELLGRLVEWGTGRLIAPAALKKAGIQWANWFHDLIEEDYGIKLEKVSGDRTRLTDRMLEAPDWMSLQKQCQDLALSVQFYLNVTKTSLKEKVVDEIKAYLDSHYHENIQLDQLAERFDLNSSYVGSVYSKSTGQTILEYITWLRIRQAKKMLRESSFKISKISSNLGYDNQRYFCQVFKKHVGVSPGQYRDEHMVKSEENQLL